MVLGGKTGKRWSRKQRNSCRTWKCVPIYGQFLILSSTVTINSFVRFISLFVKYKYKTALRHKNVGRPTCSRTSLIFSAFLSLLAYSCTSSSPMSLVSLTRKVRPWSTVSFSVSLCPDKCFICWHIWGRVALITLDIFRKLLMRFLVRLQGCVVISCGAKRLLALKKDTVYLSNLWSIP